MKLLDRYIATIVVQSTLVVMVVVLALFAFATFATEVDKVGRGGYGVAHAAQYTLLLLPRQAYQLFPIMVLLGTIVGLGMLAGNSELVVIRAAGVSLLGIVGSAMKAGVAMMAVMIVVGEYVAPAAEVRAQNLRAEALEKQVSFRSNIGLWARDGDTVVHFRDLVAEGSVANVSIYEFDDQRRLHRLVRAKSARYEGDRWVLMDVSSSRVSEEGVTTRRSAEMAWRSLLNPELVGVVTVKPEQLSALGLYRYVGYLAENGLDAGRYVLALWRKVMVLAATAVMILLAAPLVFGPLRSVGVGQRVFVGTLFGIGFYVIDQTVGQMSLVYGLPPVMGAVAAPVVFFAVALAMIRRIR